MDSYALKIGERIKLVREQQKLSQKAFAEKCGDIPSTTISKYEQGLIKPSAEILSKMGYIGININWLLTGEGEMMRGKGEAEEVVSEAVEALSENRMLEKIVLMLADMSEEVQGEVFAHVQKAKHLSDLERRVEELEAERAG